MTTEQLAREVANGLVSTGVEGGFASVSCSTAGDYPSIGCSQWEGERANELLNSIPGGQEFTYVPYSEIDVDSLSALLDSPEGQQAQLDILATDCETYVNRAIDCGLTDARCVIYAAMWGPTSTYVMGRFIQRRLQDGYDISGNLEELHQVWHDMYTDAAGVSERYRAGYENRADNTYEYVSSLDLSAYGY